MSHTRWRHRSYQSARVQEIPVTSMTMRKNHCVSHQQRNVRRSSRISSETDFSSFTVGPWIPLCGIAWENGRTAIGWPGVHCDYAWPSCDNDLFPDMAVLFLNTALSSRVKKRKCDKVGESCIQFICYIINRCAR